MKWGLLLHIYQPPNQRPDILDLVSREGYSLLLDVLLETKYPITLNVTGTLVEQLAQNGQTKVLDKLRELYTHKNITFTDTAYTHALLPLWPEAEITHQIEQNRLIQQEYLDPAWRGTGLYLPELAYGPEIDLSLDDLKVPWVLVDQLSLTSESYHPTAFIKHSSAVALVRHRQLSMDLASDPNAFGETIASSAEPLIAALDGEVFGHFDPHAINRLRLALREYGFALESLNTLAKIPPAAQSPIRTASWETSEKDLSRRTPYPLWKNRRNPIHRALWHFYAGVYKAISTSGGLKESEWTRRHFDNSVASCYWWWANVNKTAGPMKTSVWNPDVILMGITEAIKAVRSDPLITNRRKWQLETEHAELLKLIWRTHWRQQN